MTFGSGARRFEGLPPKLPTPSDLRSSLAAATAARTFVAQLRRRLVTSSGRMVNWLFVSFCTTGGTSTTIWAGGLDRISESPGRRRDRWDAFQAWTPVQL